MARSLFVLALAAVVVQASNPGSPHSTLQRQPSQGEGSSNLRKNTLTGSMEKLLKSPTGAALSEEQKTLAIKTNAAQKTLAEVNEAIAKGKRLSDKEAEKLVKKWAEISEELEQMTAKYEKLAEEVTAVDAKVDTFEKNEDGTSVFPTDADGSSGTIEVMVGDTMKTYTEAEVAVLHEAHKRVTLDLDRYEKGVEKLRSSKSARRWHNFNVAQQQELERIAATAERIGDALKNAWERLTGRLEDFAAKVKNFSIRQFIKEIRSSPKLQKKAKQLDDEAEELAQEVASKAEEVTIAEHEQGAQASDDSVLKAAVAASKARAEEDNRN